MQPEIVCNGELGRVLAVSDAAVVVRFEAPERLVYVPMRKRREGEQEVDDESGNSRDDGDNRDNGSKSDFCLAYAATVHKFQGSEVPLAVCVVDDGAGLIASRELIYTAVSRAKRLCIVVGKKATILRQIKRVALPMRKTFLREILVGDLS